MIIITHIRESNNRIITDVKAITGAIYTKTAIIQKIKEGTTVLTQDPNGNKATVTIKRNGLNEHISTIPDNITSNNLDRLPKF